MMTDWDSFSNRERKRPLICAETPRDFQSFISPNVCSAPVEQRDETERKRRREAEMCIGRTTTIETTPRRVITLKEYAERQTRQLSSSVDTSENVVTASEHPFPPSPSTLEEGEAVDSDEQDTDDTPKSPPLSLSLPDIQLPPFYFTRECLAQVQEIFLANQLTANPINDNSYAHRYNSAALPVPYRAWNSSKIADCCEHAHQPPLSTLHEHDDSLAFPTLREAMVHISERLVGSKSIPIVDTHCHFDLIFDRLGIQHNDLEQYFQDYQDFYPSGLHFELAIHVFWRPRQITFHNWNNRYSKYLSHQRVFGACGIHPHWSFMWRDSSIEDVERCLRHPKVVALGEIGLDFGPKNTCDIDQQCRVFVEQLKLATKCSKPVVIHSRNAYLLTFKIMKQFLGPTHPIHLHCFVGTLDDVALFTSYFTDIKFGFTPLITRRKTLHSVIEQLDLRQILSETDSPYFIPEELVQYSRCAHPGMVYSVVEVIARIRQLSIGQVADQLRENARCVYGV